MTARETSEERTAYRDVRNQRHEHGPLLLQIAVSCPYDAGELSRRIARAPETIHEDLQTLMAEGAVYVHDGVLRTTVANRIISEASAAELREVYDQVLAEIAAGAPVRSATLVALAESGCTDESLLHLLINMVGEHEDDSAALRALFGVARARGIDDEELRLLQAADAAANGRNDRGLTITDELLASSEPAVTTRAAILAAGIHIMSNDLEHASALFRHIEGEEVSHEGAWGVVAAIGIGESQLAEQRREAMGEWGLTSHAAGLFSMADGLLESVNGNGEGALDLLARSVTTLSPLGSKVFLPESPAALASLVALGRGEPATASLLLERALRAELGGAVIRQRHLLLLGWALMTQGELEQAERTLADLDTTFELRDRDRLLKWSLKAGIARRRLDNAAMKEAWREVRAQTFGMRLTLFDLPLLGELMMVSARLRETERIRSLVEHGSALLAALGGPIVWSAPLHWGGVHAAFEGQDPAALIPHANALVKGGKVSPYAATLARAGNTWLEVLRREAEFESVEISARELAKYGHAWEGARLAGQAALQHPERDGALSMMQLARDISKSHYEQAPAAPESSVLTARELEVSRLVLDGQGYRAIGERLYISPKTVEHHVARIRSRLGATSRGELLEMLHDLISRLDG